MTDDGHLGMPNFRKFKVASCKEEIVTQTWYDSTEIFFVPHFGRVSKEGHLDYFHLILKKKEKQNLMQSHLGTHLFKIHSVIIEILSFSCFVLFLSWQMGAILECQTAKIEMTSCREHSITKLMRFYRDFLCFNVCFLETGAILTGLFLFNFDTWSSRATGS